jgi:DMSO/TMAO reductase YedYZ molybdopterin-dependent catalytic subunit
MTLLLPRRKILSGLALGTGGLLIGGCDALSQNDRFRSVLRSAEDLNKASHRLLTNRAALAREFSESDMSPIFRMNGSIDPGTAEYAQHQSNGFADWRLRVDGLVAKPLDVSLAQLHAMPSREQITRHDCVEGWSAIASFTALISLMPIRIMNRST